jgi:hypothetical protein
MQVRRRRHFRSRCRALALECVLVLLIVTPGGATVQSPALRAWDDYRVIMWIGERAFQRPERLPLFFQRLREMGVDTGMVYSDADPRPLVENQMPYYVENIVNIGLCLKRNSPVVDWDKLVATWTSSRDEALLVRPYGLDDSGWRDWARRQMQAVVRANRAHTPLAYDIRDELSTTIGTNPFDYDFSPTALAEFRRWLQTQYPSLAALNRQWETRFATWDDVRPFTTDAIKHRMASGRALPRGMPDWAALARVGRDPTAARRTPTAWNFSPWADFRTYMDISLASVLDELRTAAHELDPQTPVGIEGAQAPHAFGGSDLWRLSQVVDWVEPYDVGNAREIFASFMPGKPLLSTISESDTQHAGRKLWHSLFQGDRGCIVWWSDTCIDWQREDLALTAQAQALAPALREMRGPLARLVLRARRIYDPIAIHYSQPSIQVDWLRESAAHGANWARYLTAYDETHNRMLQVRNSWLKALQDLGYSPRFVSTAQIEGGALRSGGWRVFVMPHSLALSDKEVAEIRAFREGGGEVLADVPVSFDEHGTLRRSEPFAAPAPAILPIAGYAGARLQSKMPTDWSWLAERCRTVPRDVVLAAAPATRTQIHRYRLGTATLVAFERNVEYHSSEDIVAAGGNANLEKAVDLQARFAAAAHVYDLRQRRYLGFTDHIAFTLDPWEPSLYALLPQPVPAETVVDALLQRAD